VEALLPKAAPDGERQWTPFVSNIDYDAKGQRLLIAYGNGVVTTYTYDKETFRLASLLTTRPPAAGRNDCPDPPLADWPGCQVQDLRYTYDPAGNITHIQDDAQQTIFFDNKRVEPSNDYTYDAIYRLIEAKGREHLGQNQEPIPHSHDDAGRTNRPHPTDGRAMGSYVELYQYDEVGNIRQMRHSRTDGGKGSWTRAFAYNEPSLLEHDPAAIVGKSNNRLSTTKVGSDSAQTYAHDAHGNMTRMPHLGGTHDDGNMYWDHRDQLHQCASVDGTVWYVYDAAGQRVRKVWEKQRNQIEERISFGGFEIFRAHNGPIGTNSGQLEREMLHIMDDRQRIALVETRTWGNDPRPLQLVPAAGEGDPPPALRLPGLRGGGGAGAGPGAADHRRDGDRGAPRARAGRQVL
jgi:YD repeat-containing protein